MKTKWTDSKELIKLIEQTESFSFFSIQWNHSNGNIYRVLGLLSLVKGDYIDSTLNYDVALEKGYPTTLIYNDLAEYLYYMGNDSKAISYWVKAGNLRKAMVLADYLLSENKFEQARNYYKGIIQIDPNATDAYIGIGRVEYLLQYYNEAIFWFSKAVELDGKNYIAMTELGTSYFHANNDIELAKNTILKAIEIAPNCQWCMLKLGGVFNDAGLCDEANFWFNLARLNGAEDFLINQKIIDCQSR